MTPATPTPTGAIPPHTDNATQIKPKIDSTGAYLREDRCTPPEAPLWRSRLTPDPRGPSAAVAGGGPTAG